ncbi:hypothetical protein EON67_04705, partial [archaeon]
MQRVTRIACWRTHGSDTYRGMMPFTSPGPYTTAGRRMTYGKPGTAFTASSARSMKAACVVHG